MVLDSRVFAGCISEMEVNAICELKSAEENAHDQMALHILQANIDGQAAHREGTATHDE